MVIGDYFTEWKEYFALPNHTAYIIVDKRNDKAFV